MNLTKNVIEQREIVSQNSLKASKYASALVKNLSYLKQTENDIIRQHDVIDKTKNFTYTKQEIRPK